LTNFTQASEAGGGGYAGDLTPPTILSSGDIDMYIPLEKSNT